jgi:Na+/H+ antiporter NhaD/arsenite permease-like protein
MKSRRILECIDWHLITLFCALFIIVHGIETAGIPNRIMESLRAADFDFQNPYTLSLVSAVSSNLFSNVPATMLLVKFLDPNVPAQWYTLAVSSTFAGNLITIGSIANLIVIEQAARCGVRISFGEHARAGIPVTLLSFVVMAAYLAVLR